MHKHIHKHTHKHTHTQTHTHTQPLTTRARYAHINTHHVCFAVQRAVHDRAKLTLRPRLRASQNKLCCVVGDSDEWPHRPLLLAHSKNGSLGVSAWARACVSLFRRAQDGSQAGTVARIVIHHGDGIHEHQCCFVDPSPPSTNQWKQDNAIKKKHASTTRSTNKLLRIRQDT